MSDPATSVGDARPTSSVFVLADKVSEGRLSAFVLELRASGMSTERIAKELFRRWDVDVSANTVGGWLKGLAVEAADKAAS